MFVKTLFIYIQVMVEVGVILDTQLKQYDLWLIQIYFLVALACLVDVEIILAR